MIFHFKTNFPLNILAIPACLLASLHGFSLGEEEEPVKMEIESEPDEFAADLLIAEAQGKPISPEEIEQERKRTRVGAGEWIKLVLVGKKALIEDPDQLVWRIEPGKGDNWATIKRKEEDPTMLADISLVIKDDLIFEPSEPKDPEQETGDTPFQTEGEVNVQVLQEGKVIAEKSFTAVLPSGITAEHEGRPVSGQDGEYGEGFPKDGDWEPAGASAVLNLTFHPTDVSFHNLAKIEVDHGFKKHDDNGKEVEFHKIPTDLLEVHRPTPYATRITKQNGGRDHIGARKDVDIFKDPLVHLPVGWTWLCGFYTARENAGQEDRYARIGIYEQKIDFLQHTPGDVRTIEIILSKFKCRVNRITGGDHSFTTTK